MTRTRPFTTRSGDYLSVLLSLWLPRYGWTVFIPIVICLVIGAIYDERFLLIALMLLFIVIPMLSSFLYPYYMLTPEARRAVHRKEVEIAEGSHIRLIYLPDEEKSDSHKRELLPLERDEGQAESIREHKWPVPQPEEIPWSDVVRVKYTPRFRVYILKAPRLTFLLIPHESFLPMKE